ncbi:MAG: beta-phosphoglucomutase [Candidatus Flexifilum sp.]|jgi:beta-phosphoglucomutase
MMTPDIQAFIFDLDGVITDTAEFHYLSWKRLADEVGVPFTRAENDQLRGLSRRDSLNVILKGRAIDEATAQEWMTRKNQYYLGYLETIRPSDALPGVLELLDDARAHGIRIALASASRNARPVLDRLGIAERFDAIGDGYCVVNTKPAPDIFLWVAGRLNVHPQQAVVFEDAEAGIEAALRGGFWTVGLGGANVSRAHVRFDSLVGVRAIDLIARLNQSCQ